MLTAQAAMEEVHDVVFAMPVESAPGPDGFSGKIFQVSWEFIKEDILLAVNFFLKGGAMPMSVCSILLSLIPKVKNLVHFFFTEFRPISLCNFLYKIFTKILATKLSVVLPSIIFGQQHGFVKERHIGDCISMAQFMVGELDRKV